MDHVMSSTQDLVLSAVPHAFVVPTVSLPFPGAVVRRCGTFLRHRWERQESRSLDGLK